jgi:flagellar biosynthesis/type III secretory pathway chaperone
MMIDILQKLIEALRNELQQYGEMLALLDHQQELVRLCGADEILHSISAINAQSAAIQTAREHRQSFQHQLAHSIQRPDDSTFADLLPGMPEEYRPLVNALVQENNELLERVRQRARQNHLLLSRSLELMQRFITALPPQHHPVLVTGAEGLAPQSSSLYEAIV